MESISEVVVVFPFVPVTATAAMRSPVWSKKFAAVVASALRAFATRIQTTLDGIVAGAASSLQWPPRRATPHANKRVFVRLSACSAKTGTRLHLARITSYLANLQTACRCRHAGRNAFKQGAQLRCN